MPCLPAFMSHKQPTEYCSQVPKIAMSTTQNLMFEDECDTQYSTVKGQIDKIEKFLCVDRLKQTRKRKAADNANEGVIKTTPNQPHFYLCTISIEVQLITGATALEVALSVKLLAVVTKFSCKLDFNYTIWTMSKHCFIWYLKVTNYSHKQDIYWKVLLLLSKLNV